MKNSKKKPSPAADVLSSSSLSSSSLPLSAAAPRQKSVGLFVDKAVISVSGGDGGDGAMSFRREKYVPFGGPNGGNGGKGGDVWLEASTRSATLLDFKYRPNFKAAPGGKGEPSDRTGASGEDLVIEAPVGTIVRKNREFLADLAVPHQRVIVAAGGRGGRGNKSFKTRFDTAPRVYEKGQPSETATLELELKLIADIGIIGLPNAGKSSILARVTSAHPKIASYPFTTLSPNLGVARIRSGSFVLADIPGIIEGAHDGRGLGHDFLRHIERTKMLLHVIDGSGASGDPFSNYKVLLAELGCHSKALLEKPAVIAFNKTDAPGTAKNLTAFRRRVKGKKIFPISAVAGDGLTPMLDECASLAANAPPAQRAAPSEDIRRFVYAPEFSIARDIGGAWVVRG
ncbi:MAG: GTPase ObgE, partial [Endomicrobiia bacterium]|nr:GTPase ObgE [Endomicrobiia bacterium]